MNAILIKNPPSMRDFLEIPSNYVNLHRQLFVLAVGLVHHLAGHVDERS